MPRADDLCPLGFAPHAVRPSRCKRCFRDYNDHKPKEDPKPIKKNEDTKTGARKREQSDNKSPSEEPSKSDAPATEKTSNEESKTLRRRSRTNDEDDTNTKTETEQETASGIRRRREKANDDDNNDEENNSNNSRTRVRSSITSTEDVERSPSPPTSPRRTSDGGGDNGKERRRSRQRIQILSAQEVKREEIPGLNLDEDTSADVAFILQVKTSSRARDDDDETMSTALTDITETTLTYGDSLEDLQTQIQQLKTQLETAETSRNKLEEEKAELIEKRSKDALEIEKLNKIDLELSKLRVKVRELQTANEDLKDENNVLKLEAKETQDEMEKRPSQEEVRISTDELRAKLAAAETLCEELMEENEDIKREIRDLEDEIEEMQDNFREDQADEYSVLKKELEQTAKNCRVLQFKLRKAEKKCEHLESDKNQYEDQLKGLIKGGHLDVNHAEKLRQMELEVNTAREISIRMHSEVESLQNKLRYLQEEKESLSKKKSTADGTTSPDGSKSPSPHRREAKPEIHHRPKENSLEVDSAQLLRDLCDTIERENDLKEQFKFIEEEATNLRKKLSFLEQENEMLVLQLKKMATSSKRTKRPSSREENRDDDSGISDDTDELSPSEVKLQLEMSEQETGVLRRKVDEIDAENQALQKEVKELQDKLAEKPSLKFDLPSKPPADPARANIFFEQKVQLLENEAKELRIKLIDKERENERLNNEMQVKQRKGSKAGLMTRSRSLDSDTQIDLKRQLQLVEQEALILRSKTIELEEENDKLSIENHRLQVRAGKKAPLTPQQQLAAENNQLKEKITNLEKKINATQGSNSSLSTDSGENSVELASAKEQMIQKDHEATALKRKMESLTKENDKLVNELKVLKEKSKVEIKRRRKVLDSAPKFEFRKAIEDLEEELNKITVAMTVKESELELMKTDYSEQKKALEIITDDNNNLERKYKLQLDELNKQKDMLSKNLASEKESLNKVNETLKKLEKEVAEGKSTSGKASVSASGAEDLKKMKQEIESLKTELESEKTKNKSKATGSSEKVSFEELRKAEQDKHRLQKQIADYQRLLSESEKRVTDAEQANKEMEKSQRNLRRQIDDLNAEVDQEKHKLKKVDSRQTEVTMSWLKERDELKKQKADLQKKLDELKTEIEDKDKKIQDQDSTVHQEKKRKLDLQTSLKQKDEELKHTKENNSKLKAKLKELTEKFSKVDKDMEELTDKWRKLDILYKKEKDEWTSRHNDLDSLLKLEIKRRERDETEHERDLRDRDEEMIRMRDKVRKAEADMKKAVSAADDTPAAPRVQEKIKDLQDRLGQEKREYDDLTSKYEMLEEEHVLTKAKLVMEKEQVNNNLETLRKEHLQLQGELKTVRDTFNMRQDTWIREKLDLQEKVKDFEEKFQQLEEAAWQDEAKRMKRMVDEKSNIIEQFKKGERNLKDEVDRLKRQGDDLKNKLTDLERASRGTGRSFGSEVSANKELQDLKSNLMKAEIDELRTKFQQEEKVHRSEVTALKMMNDVKVAQMQDEIQMLHIQIGKFRRERDTFKEMLEGAQRTIGDLKTDSMRRRGSTGGQELDEVKGKLQELRKLVEKLQEQLDNSERNNSRLKTEYLTEKASWEIKVAETQAKVNELEESIILQGGKSRIYGVKTKLELAWQKEREEQQRLLNESHRMAKELRQRVIDLENARDRERIEAKGQLENLRRTVECDQGETQIKISELQADLLELRDAHSKMRTTNDRIKRDKDKVERERDELKMKINESQHFQSEDLAKITAMSEELNKLAQMVPTVLADQQGLPPKATSNAPDMKKIKDSFKTTLSKITKTTDEFRRAYGVREEERLKRNLSFRRAMSATDSDLEAKPPPTPTRTRKDDPLSRWQNPQRVTNYPTSPPSMFITPPRQRANTSLYRKSLSLDQSLTMEEMQQGIWKTDSDTGSTSSLQETSVSHSRSRSSGGEYSSGARLEVPAAGPSPLPRKKKRFPSTQSSLESSPSSSRDPSVEKDVHQPPPRPPSPGVAAISSRSASPALSQRSRDSAGSSMKPPVSGNAKERFFAFGKSRSIEEPGDSLAPVGRSETLKAGLGASAGTLPRQKSEKPKDFKSKISNIFKKPPSRTGSLDSGDSDGAVSGSTVTTSKTLKLPIDPKQKAQYRSTGALHSTVRTLHN